MQKTLEQLIERRRMDQLMLKLVDSKTLLDEYAKEIDQLNEQIENYNV